MEIKLYQVRRWSGATDTAADDGDYTASQTVSSDTIFTRQMMSAVQGRNYMYSWGTEMGELQLTPSTASDGIGRKQPRRNILSRNAIARYIQSLYVCLCVCYTLVLYQNG